MQKKILGGTRSIVSCLKIQNTMYFYKQEVVK